MNRRQVLCGLIAAPAVIRLGGLMSIHDPIIRGIWFHSGHTTQSEYYDKKLYFSPNINPGLIYNNLKDWTFRDSSLVVPTKLSRFSDHIEEQKLLGYKSWSTL